MCLCYDRVGHICLISRRCVDLQQAIASMVYGRKECILVLHDDFQIAGQFCNFVPMFEAKAMLLIQSHPVLTESMPMSTNFG